MGSVELNGSPNRPSSQLCAQVLLSPMPTHTPGTPAFFNCAAGRGEGGSTNSIFHPATQSLSPSLSELLALPEGPG